jgi:hypothetical protein
MDRRTLLLGVVAGSFAMVACDTSDRLAERDETTIASTLSTEATSSTSSLAPETTEHAAAQWTAAPGPIDGVAVSADGLVLSAYFTGAPDLGADSCRWLYRVEASESMTEVTLSLRQQFHAGPAGVGCVDLATLQHVDVELSAPVGDRKIITWNGEMLFAVAKSSLIVPSWLPAGFSPIGSYPDPARQAWESYWAAETDTSMACVPGATLRLTQGIGADLDIAPLTIRLSPAETFDESGIEVWSDPDDVPRAVVWRRGDSVAVLSQEVKCGFAPLDLQTMTAIATSLASP